MKSSFFYGGHGEQVAEKIAAAINAAPDFLSDITASSPRAAGDAVERIVAENFQSAAGQWCREYSSRFARRAMADLAFTDNEGFYCIVDVKTHRIDAKFSMPNLISVERLARFYEDDANVFSVMMVSYAVDGNRLRVREVVFCPIEFLSWDCLTVGALGWGQIQIADSGNIAVNRDYSRKRWMLELCDMMLAFYPKEISKIGERMGRFEREKSRWAEKPDIWL